MVNVGPKAVDITQLRAPRNGVFIYGLWMEGARFDQEQMVLNESHIKIYFIFGVDRF